MATLYQVQIAMSTDTVTSLSNGGYRLYGFKAVQATAGGGAPLVWFSTNDYSTATTVQWEEAYQAFTSLQDVANGVTILASFSVGIDLTQTLEVTGSQGTGEVINSGTAGAISFENTTTTPFTCGISEQQNGNLPTPLCAFPLFGNGLDVIAPVEKVLLTFATTPVNTGTVIEQAFAQGYLIDLTEAPDNTRSVAFDINTGWSNAGNDAWAQIVAPNADLPPLLIDSSPSAVRALIKKAA